LRQLRPAGQPRELARTGGRPWEMRIARAIMTIARKDRVSLFDGEALARAFLAEAPADRALGKPPTAPAGNGRRGS
jgi:hypothetical protein